ncbi:MAG: acylneuraminate cytidylyltransferase family protein [Flavobacteriales bacterium]|nr:acylneuraminate cytidylyltransferase family protein [Flavobacteriales bacterium]
MNERIIAIIPARGGSKRLPKKNIYPWKGKPLIAYTIEACQQCSFIQQVFVSSDDDEILSVGKSYGATPLKRPVELSGDETPKILAIRQAVLDAEVMKMGKPDVIIIPQANSPQISAEQMERGFRLMIDHNLWEVMSADNHGVQNAAFRIVRYNALFNNFLSAHCGFVVAENVDVHTIEDMERLG